MSTKGKTYKVKAKPIHYRAVQKLTENGGHLGKALLEAGYSKSIAESPKKVTTTKGFIEAMSEAGLDLDTLNGYLASDLKSKPKQRLGELTLAYKLHGKLKDTKEGDKTLILITSGESATRYNLTPQESDSVN